MGFRIQAQQLELPEYADKDNPDDSLIVTAILPTVKEGATINAGRAMVPDETAEGGERRETAEELQRRVFGLMAPKLRSWNLESEEGEAVPLPRDLYPGNSREALAKQVDHLYDQDENAILAIWVAWRSAGMPKKADSDEGKDSAAPSTPGPGASPANDVSEWDMRELEQQIPMS